MSDMAALAAQVVSDDDAIKARVRRLVISTIELYEEMLITGTPAVKAQLIRSVVPAMLKEMQEEKVDDSIVNLRAEMREMMEQVRQPVTIHTPLEDENGDMLPEDTPRLPAPDLPPLPPMPARRKVQTEEVVPVDLDPPQPSARVVPHK